MDEVQKLKDIPRGNTAPGVARLVLERVTASSCGPANFRVLDIPCGKGEFLDTLKRVIPNAETTGADLNLPPNFDHTFLPIDASRPFAADFHQNFTAITCISGVMEFDNTLSFFEQIREVLADDGEFVVTNDNLLSVRDRLLYLLFGRFRQYRHAVKSGTPTWKILPLQNLVRILADAGFDTCKITYVPPKSAEWLWLPLATLVYVTQFVYIQMESSDVDKLTLREMFPFRSLLSRHYILVCRPKPKGLD